MIYACVEIDKKSALYCAVWSLLTAQTAYEAGTSLSCSAR